ncbi:hypothetical protein FXB41_07110 [Bradyrhizobium canariense]|nr:hypothetical protein [Bradyrhizobium canariense]
MYRGVYPLGRRRSDDRIASRERLNPVVQAALVTLCGLILGTVSRKSQRRIVALLRAGSTSALDGLTGNGPGELPVLVADEIFTGLLDNIERLADNFVPTRNNSVHCNSLCLAQRSHVARWL